MIFKSTIMNLLHRSLFIMVACFFIFPNITNSIYASNKNTKSDIDSNLLIVTDFGRDVDDAQAFATIASLIDRYKNNKGRTKPKLSIAGIIVTGDIPFIKAKSLELFLNLFEIKAPIAIANSKQKKDYLSTHSINNTPYELSLLDSLAQMPQNKILNSTIKDESYFINIDRLLDSLTNSYSNLTLVVLAPPTEIGSYLDKHSSKIQAFSKVYVQGQAKIVDKKISPDFRAYNLREDSLASYKLFKISNKLPFYFIGKDAVYPCAFTRRDFYSIKQNAFTNKYNSSSVTKNSRFAGKYLYLAAENGLISFLQRDPSTFKKIFKTTSIDSLEIMNNPYDLLTILAIVKPHLFPIEQTIIIPNKEKSQDEIKHIIYAAPKKQDIAKFLTLPTI